MKACCKRWRSVGSVIFPVLCLLRRPSGSNGRELAAAFGHLCAVHASYWDRDWRREHRGLGRYPEHHLWAAVQGYMDLYDAAEPTD